MCSIPEAQSTDLNPEIRKIVDAARSVWTRRLIDYSRANSLLFFRDLKVGSLDLTMEPDVVSQLLEGEPVTLDLLVSQSQLAEIPDPVARTRAEAEASKKVRDSLVAIHRKALSNREEKGIETLHLAMGMATWQAADGGRPYEAPVLLLPASIEARGRAGDDLRLKVTGDPQLNPVLLHLLAEDYSVHIDPTLVLSECGNESQAGQWHIDKEKLYAIITSKTKTINSFCVKSRVVLANFQFAKMAMVEDLKKNGDTIASSTIVAAIAGHSKSRKKLAQVSFDIEPAQIDEIPAKDDHLVLDADSTQHRVIVLACKGQNGVIQGPPGTGKSQTIANLIAQSVADGKRVLFVAEKRAALDAVIKRLNHPDVGLGHLVLDLHGATVSRKEVMTQLGNALDQVRFALPADGEEEVHRKFEARRKQLNEHAHRVNELRKPSNLSVNQMLGKLLRLPPAAKSMLRLRDETLAVLDAVHADEVRQCILDGTANAQLLLGTDPSPWNNAKITEGHQAQAAIDLAKRATDLWPKLMRLLHQKMLSLDLQLPKSLDEIARFLALLSDTQTIRKRYGNAIYKAKPGTLAQTLQPASAGWLPRTWAFLRNAQYRAARKHLISLRGTPVPTTVLYEEALAAEDVICRWRTLGNGSEVPDESEGEVELASTFTSFKEVTSTLAAIIEGDSFDDIPLKETETRLRALATDLTTPYRLPHIHDIRSRLCGAGLDSFLDELREQDISFEYWVDRFDYVWLSSTLDQVFASETSLASFNGRTHGQIVAEFNELDQERIRLAAARVKRLHAHRAHNSRNIFPDQDDLVKREVLKRSRHIPVRDLLARAPDVLTQLVPCWVASPLSVSQLLDGDRRHFDIVVFDEASQILQEEAIAAIYRAEQVIVAGDRHQLPPTTFFATAIEGEDDIYTDDEDTNNTNTTVSEAIGGFESLLGTLEAFLPNWLLEWHYRSEDERLITFSNTHIYDGRLVTFPGARGHQAIRHILVAHDPSLGGQEESASREVEEVIRQVLDHVKTRPKESLGVITMGIKHANRVQAALDSLRYEQPGFSDFFSTDRMERFFVKNLETVQGDERDAIILSIGYGKAANGDLPHHFGPLSQDVGYRRLNVAITRAKRRMCVISSFAHDEIDLNRSGSRGVQLLKSYLEYAASGGTRLPEVHVTSDITLNPFEADVRDALEFEGIKTLPQFGASRYRIDLVAMHPNKPGRPVLAIECDGAAYHSSATARDRDRLRQAHLQRLGWCFHRIWSTDWFYSREQEIARTVAVFEEAVRRADHLDADTAPLEDFVLSEPATPVQTQPVVPTRRPQPQIPIRERIEQYSDLELMTLANWITSDGLLRTDEELLREMFKELPFRRLGPKIRNRLLKIVKLPIRKQLRE